MAAQHYLFNPTPEDLAKRYHELYEHYAPTFNYKTRRESAVSWENVPFNNKTLMIQVCSDILEELSRGITCDKTCIEEGCDCEGTVWQTRK